MHALLLALTLFLALTPLAQAQWAWKDANGRTVFSDRPPPADIKPSQITKQPPAYVAPVDTGDAAKASMPAPDSAPKRVEITNRAKTPAEREAEFRKRQVMQADDEKKAAKDAEQKQKQAEICDRLRRSLASLESGQRVATTTKTGEIAFMDDATRQSEIERNKQSIAESCK
jgi:hypothetical protein